MVIEEIHCSVKLGTKTGEIDYKPMGGVPIIGLVSADLILRVEMAILPLTSSTDTHWTSNPGYPLNELTI